MNPAPRRLRVATCAKRPEPTPDDAILLAALGRLGVDVAPIPWQSLAPEHDGPPVLLRSTWDYYRYPGQFRAWLEAHLAAGTRLLNPAKVALGNMDKGYLREMPGAGVSIPRSHWLARPDRANVQALLRSEGWNRAVLKPRISATAYGTVIVSQDTEVPDEPLAISAEHGALLQEFLPEIATGELSLVWLDGAFSHAVRKVPEPGDFRVQTEFGGRSEAVTPSAAALALGERAMARIGDGCIYGRVDLVETARGPLLMELELIEPELFFRLAPAAAPRLADALCRCLWP